MAVFRQQLVCTMQSHQLGLPNGSASCTRTFGLIIECDKSKPCASLQQVMATNCKQYSPSLALDLKDFSFGSDHVPFQQAGIASFLAIEGDDTEYQYCKHALLAVTTRGAQLDWRVTRPYYSRYDGVCQLGLGAEHYSRHSRYPSRHGRDSKP
jgi:hypothetical protein